MVYYFVNFLFFNISNNLILYFVIAIGGFPIIWQIFSKLLKFNIGADLIAFIALILAIYLNENVTAVLIILMISSGQTLEEYATHKACFVLESLEKRIPKNAHLQDKNNYHDIPINDIKIGDKIAIFPHEICPVDGEIIQGKGHMDESYLTGEPYKLSKTIGSKVLSGAINGESLFIIKAEKLANES
ncbi:MAG: heavy metal translocating P-type ATPase, partial [Alphaproteobacteria bacterium]